MKGILRGTAACLGAWLLLCLLPLPAAVAASDITTVEQARAELRRLRMSYTERHPDVIRVKRVLERLLASEEARKRELNAARAKAARQPRPPARLETPAPAALSAAASAPRGQRPLAGGVSRQQRLAERRLLQKALAAQAVSLPAPAPRAAPAPKPTAASPGHRPPQAGVSRQQRLEERRILQKALAADGVQLD